MRPIPKKLLNQILSDPYYNICARRSADCDGRITFEHALIWAGRQINAKFAIIPLCSYHHLGKGLDKDFNRYLALKRASDDDLAQYPKRDWKQELSYLENKYGKTLS